MANWCRFLIMARGTESDLARMQKKVNGVLVRREADDDLLLAVDKLYPDCKEWLLTDHGWVDGKIQGECKWDPPSEFISRLSAEWPNLVFNLTYNVEEMWDGGVYEVYRGNSKLSNYQYGYFEMATEDKPIHHSWVFINGDSSVVAQAKQALEQAAMTINTKKDRPVICADALATRHSAQEVHEVLKNYPAIAWTVLPFTLNEDLYLKSLGPDGEIYRQHWAGMYLPEFQQICERSIVLRRDETEYLLDHLLRYLYVIAKSPDNNINTCYDVTRLSYLPQNVCGPLPIELRCILGMPGLGVTRIQEIHEALASPRWTTSWPMWERQPPGEIQTSAPNPSSEKDFFDRVALADRGRH